MYSLNYWRDRLKAVRNDWRYLPVDSVLNVLWQQLPGDATHTTIVDLVNDSTQSFDPLRNGERVQRGKERIRQGTSANLVLANQGWAMWSKQKEE